MQTWIKFGEDQISAQQRGTFKQQLKKPKLVP